MKKGGAYGGSKMMETNGEREGGTFLDFTPEAKASKVAEKKSDGFKRGGATMMKGKKRAMGGMTDADGISRAPMHAEDKGMKRGGMMKKRKDGGMVDGEKPMMNLAKRARGGRTSAPFSSAHMPGMRDGRCESGHEGE